MPTEYDAATALQRVDERSFTAELDPGWFVAGPNGGYLAALLLRAVQSVPEGAGRPARSMTVQYPKAGVAGPVTVDVEVTRVGRSLAFLTAQLRQDGAVIAQAMTALGDGRSEVTFQDLRPDLPRPEELAPADVDPRMAPPIIGRFDYRPVESIPMLSADRSDVWCWLRLADQRPVDDAVLALMTDALAPAMLFRKGPPHVYPTVDLTVHLRNSVPADHDGWCLGHAVTRTAARGFIEEDCDIYDRAGTLLAQGRQLALMVPLG